MDGAQTTWTEIGAWLVGQALPLWAAAGFDRARGAFVERLDFRAQPVTGVPRRLMVQARQLFAYSTAARRGWMPDAAGLVITGAHSMIRDYHEAGSAAGWAMAVDERGRVVDAKRDLYAHAFALLGLASAYRVDPDQRYLDIADRTLAFLDDDMAAAAGGYVSELPLTDPTLRQNPHMHLLEALLALHDVAPRRGYDNRAETLVTLFAERMFQRDAGILPELFDAHWMPLAGDAGRHFEPGHHHEWVWLLDWHAQATGQRRAAVMQALARSANTLGRSPAGTLWSSVRADGVVLDATPRIWPLTEAVKAALTGIEVDDPRVAAGTWLGVLYRRFIEPAPAGGWYDQLDADHQPRNDYMPASSLYHIVCALAEYDRRVGPPIARGAG